MFKKTIKVKKHNPELPDFEKLAIGDWIDLRFSSIISLSNANNVFSKDEKGVEYIAVRKDQIILIDFDVSMQLPKDNEAILASRSSLFKKYGLVLVNGIGVIDNSYCGDSDTWKATFLCTKNVRIDRYDRIAQFRIQKRQPKIKFKYVESLNNSARGGFGSTGHK